jgi:hypothetical protein
MPIQQATANAKILNRIPIMEEASTRSAGWRTTPPKS